LVVFIWPPNKFRHFNQSVIPKTYRQLIHLRATRLFQHQRKYIQHLNTFKTSKLPT